MPSSLKSTRWTPIAQTFGHLLRRHRTDRPIERRTHIRTHVGCSSENARLFGGGKPGTGRGKGRAICAEGFDQPGTYLALTWHPTAPRKLASAGAEVARLGWWKEARPFPFLFPSNRRGGKPIDLTTAFGHRKGNRYIDSTDPARPGRRRAPFESIELDHPDAAGGWGGASLIAHV